MIRDISNEMAAVDKSLNASSQGILGLVSSCGRQNQEHVLAGYKSKINKQTATAALFLAGGETVFGAMDIWDRLLIKQRIGSIFHVAPKGGAGAAKLNLADKSMKRQENLKKRKKKGCRFVC